jgi:hypothetical protein
LTASSSHHGSDTSDAFTGDNMAAAVALAPLQPTSVSYA